jgi:chromosome segregation ATPase
LTSLLQLPTLDTSAESRQVRVLENRLDKATNKLNEALSINKTYEQILARLEKDRSTFDSQLKAIEATLSAKEKDYEELLLLSHDAYHAKEMAQAELHRFEQGVMEERNLRDREVQEKRALVLQRVEMNARLEQRERMLRNMRELEGSIQTVQQSTSALEAIAGASSNGGAAGGVVTSGGAGGSLASATQSEMEKLADFETSFARLKEATGVADVNEIIQKFMSQETTYGSLRSLTEEYEKRIEERQNAIKKLKAELEEIKYAAGGAGVGNKRQVVEDFEKQLGEATIKCERNKNKYERLGKILIDINSGVGHLAELLNQVKLEGESGSTPLDINVESVEEVLSQCELKLSKIMGLVKWDGRSKLPLANPQFEEKLLRRRQADVRVKAHNDDDLDDDDDDVFEEELDDDVWGRKHVKVNSQMIVDKMKGKSKKSSKQTTASQRNTKIDNNKH